VAQLPVRKLLGDDTTQIQHAVASADGQRAAFLGTDGGISMWQLGRNELLARFTAPGPPVRNQSVGNPPMALDESGEYLALADVGGWVRVWQVNP
jgi:hypothetical protein